MCTRSRSRSNRGVALSILALALCTGTPASAARGLAPRPVASAKKTSRLEQTGVIFQVDVNYGAPLAGVWIGQGLVITPVDHATGKRSVGTYTQLGASAGIVGKTYVLSPVKRFRGVETTVGPFGTGSKIFGDRAQVPIIPGVLSIAASRTGGLGLSLPTVPMPVSFASPFSFPWLHASLSVYVTDPRLTGPANRFLDFADRMTLKVKRLVEPVTARWRTLRLASAGYFSRS